MLVLGVIYRTAKLKVLLQALQETAVITGGIMLILGAAALLGLILTRAHVSRDVAEFLTSVSDNPWVFMILVNILLLILGCLIDATAIILVTVPVLLPIAIDLGIDPIYFGVVMIINLMIGLLTPPVGSVLYITSLGHRQAGRRRLPRHRAVPHPPGRRARSSSRRCPDLVLWLPSLLGF